MLGAEPGNCFQFDLRSLAQFVQRSVAAGQVLCGYFTHAADAQAGDQAGERLCFRGGNRGQQVIGFLLPKTLPIGAGLLWSGYRGLPGHAPARRRPTAARY